MVLCSPHDLCRDSWDSVQLLRMRQVDWKPSFLKWRKVEITGQSAALPVTIMRMKYRTRPVRREGGWSSGPTGCRFAWVHLLWLSDAWLIYHSDCTVGSLAGSNSRWFLLTSLNWSIMLLISSWIRHPLKTCKKCDDHLLFLQCICVSEFKKRGTKLKAKGQSENLCWKWP